MNRSDKDFEMQNVTGQNQEGPNANTPLQRLSSSSIVGDDVRNPQGEDLGSIKDLMIDLDSGCIEYAVLQFGGFLGIGTKYFAIPFNELRVDAENKKFILNRDKDFLKDAPGFDKDHWPETNSDYYTNTNTYWGVSDRRFADRGYTGSGYSDRSSGYSDRSGMSDSDRYDRGTNSGMSGFSDRDTPTTKY